MADIRARGRGARPSPRRLATILAADVRGYTGLSEADPEGAVRAIGMLTERIERVCADQGGRLFHRAGDGFLCELPTATAGARAAVAIQQHLSSEPILVASRELRLRIGVHTGEVTEEASGDLLGHAVNVSARLQAEAAPGTVLLSGTTFALNEEGLRVRRLGELKLRNLREPVRTYEVVWADGAAFRLASLPGLRWGRRHRASLIVAGSGLVAACAAVFLGLAQRPGGYEADRAGGTRAAAIETEAARLADELLAAAERPSGRQAVRQAAMSLLSSADPLKSEARALAFESRSLAAARSLRGVYEAQARAGATAGALTETALQCAALAHPADLDLSQWAYERAHEHLPEEPIVLARLAEIATDRGDYAGAESYLTALIETDPDPGFLAQAESDLGYLAGLRGELDEAERRYRRGLAIGDVAELPDAEASMRARLGDLHTRRGLEANDPAERARWLASAREEIERSLRLSLVLRDADGAANALESLAHLAAHDGRTGEAIEAYERAYALREDQRDHAGAASTAFNLAFAHEQLGQKAARDRYLSAAFAHVSEGKVDGMIGVLHAARASFAFGDGDEEVACEALAEATRHFPEGNDGLQTMQANAMPGLTC